MSGINPTAAPAAAPTEAPVSSAPVSTPAPVTEAAPSAPAPLGDQAPSATSSGATSDTTSVSPQTTGPTSTPQSDTTATAQAPATPASNQFQPSLLEAAATPESAKPADAAAADATAPSEAPGETPSAPVKYEFKYPEGFDTSTLNSERMSAYTGILGEGKVSPEHGQKLLDMHLQELNTAAEKIAQRQWDVFNETQNRWRSEAQADPEIGGDKFATSIRTIMALVDQFGGNAQERAALLDAFKITGAGNNPSMLRFMHRAAQGLSKEAVPTPAPPPRMPQTRGRERGLSRYRESTPFKG